MLGAPAEVCEFDFAPVSGEDGVWETLACAEATALVSAGEAAVAATCATTPFEGELLGCWQSDDLPSGSFFDDDPGEDVDGAEDGEAAAIAKSWVDAPAAAFAVAGAAASAFVDAVKLFSAVDIVFKFVVGAVAEALLEFPCAGNGAVTAKASGAP